eukprot:PLAT7594.1.p1 GENE.PLAT7594.1~~PLAT7594.1.p1  ORF type:complete len:1147 (-),score=675.26 PLAT7594.1:128-3175(-)
MAEKFREMQQGLDDDLWDNEEDVERERQLKMAMDYGDDDDDRGDGAWGTAADFAPYESDDEDVFDEEELPMTLVGEAEEDAFLPDAPVPDAAPAEEETSELAQLLAELEATEIPKYDDIFDEEVADEEIVVGEVSMEEVRLQERELEKSRLEEARADVLQYKRFKESLQAREEQARERILKQYKQAEQRLAMKEKISRARDHRRQQRLHNLFRKAEDRLKHALRKQKAFLVDQYGDLRTTDPSEIGGREWRVRWERMPQTVEVRIDRLRAVKNKLPPARFVLLVSLYDRLGGNRMDWMGSGWKSRKIGMPAATRPVRHRGRFYDTELRVDQSIYTVCPSQRDVRPSMVFMLELYQLGTKKRPVDKVVGWTALPMVNARFDIVAGKFRLPLLRGEIDPTIHKYASIEEAYTQDLDRWLCNIYLDVRHMPKEIRTASGRLVKDVEVRMNFTEHLLNLQRGDREESDETAMMTARAPAVGWRGRAGRRDALDDDDDFDDDDDDDDYDDSDDDSDGSRIVSRVMAKDVAVEVGLRRRKPDEVPSLNLEDLDDATGRKEKKKKKRGGWKAFFKRRKSADDGDSEEKEPLLGGAAGGGAAAAAGGMDAFAEVAAMARGGRSKERYVGGLRRDDVFGTRRGDAYLEDYTYSVWSNGGGGWLEEGSARLRYIRSELLADLGLSNVLSLEFWTMILMLLLVLWLRMFTHYLGAWIYLTTARVPLYSFTPLVYNVIIKYPSTSVSVASEAMVVLIGPVFNLLLFFFFAAVAYLSLRFLNGVPTTLSRFVQAWGLATILDPLLILIVDLATLNYNCSTRDACADLQSAACLCSEGDAFKLYQKFLQNEGSGVVGAFFALLIYVCLFVSFMWPVYSYLLYVHMNGRMLDVYKRINGRLSDFFVPHDYEVSVPELVWIVAKAKRWRGPRGAQRTVEVQTWQFVDPLDPGFKEETTHLAIFNVELSGARQVYRHFLRLRDGSMIELFGSIADALGTQFSSLERVLLMQQEEMRREEDEDSDSEKEFVIA